MATPEYEYDIRGQICPSALLITLKQVNSRQKPLKQGQLRLVVLTDSREATSTIPAAVENMGYSVLVEQSRDHYRISITGAS